LSVRTHSELLLIDIAQYFGSREGHLLQRLGVGGRKYGLATRPMRRAPARQMTRNPAEDTFFDRGGMAALLMDPANVGGNVKDGCHIASMRGTWTMLIYGRGGMRDDDGMLSFWPRRAPEDNATFRVPVTYRGQMLDVEIGIDKVEYALREGGCLVIRHETEEIQLTPQQPRPFGWSAGGKRK
jgi:Glycosyl hydrolase family 65, C-terminal domain